MSPPPDGRSTVVGVQVEAETDARAQRDRTARVVIRGHAFVQNLRRGHYQLGLEVAQTSRLEAAFDELLATIRN